MKSVSPIFKHSKSAEVIYAEHQPEYTPLPALRNEHTLVTRWNFSDEERERIAKGEDLFLFIQHFGGAVQPVCLIVGEEPAIDQFVAVS